MSPGGMQDLTLDTVAGGAAPERFEDALKKVVENIMDPNTDPKQARSITLKVTFKPHESREHAETSLAVSTKTAAPKPVADLVYFGQHRGTKEYVATRYDPQQLELGEEPEDDDVLPIDHSKREAK